MAILDAENVKCSRTTELPCPFGEQQQMCAPFVCGEPVRVFAFV